MNTEIVETVLNEILEEQRQSIQELKGLRMTISDLQINVADLGEKVKEFQQRLTDQTVIAPPADTGPVQLVVAAGMESSREEIKQGIGRIGAIVEAQPKAVMRQFRIQLFPEADRNGNYKFFLSRTYLAVILLFALKGILMLASQYFDKPGSPSAAEPHGVNNLPALAVPAPAARTIHEKKRKILYDTAAKKDIPGSVDSLN